MNTDEYKYNTDEYKYSYNENNEGAINVNMDGSVFDEKPFLRVWYCLFLQNWVRIFIFSLLWKLSPRKLICSMKKIDSVCEVSTFLDGVLSL